MFYKKIRVISIALLGGFLSFLFTQNLYGQESSKIDGVAEFLLERANENFIYMFERKLKSNELIEVVFPSTFALINKTDLKILLTNSDVWSRSVEKDLNDLSNTILNQLIVDGRAFSTNINWYDNFNILTENSTILIDNNKYPINQLPYPRVRACIKVS